MTPRERQLAAIRREPIDRTPVDAIWIYNQKAIADYLKIDETQVLQHLGLDGRPNLLEYENEFAERSNAAGAIFWSTTHRKYPLEDASNIKDIEAYQWPDLNKFKYRNARKLAEKYGDTYALRGPFWMPVFCKACDLFGMEEAMVKMMTEPGVFEAAVRRIKPESSWHHGGKVHPIPCWSSPR